MFDNPSEGGSFLEPGRYVLRIVKLDPQPPSAEHPDWKPSVKMTLNLAKYPSLELVRDKNEDPYEWWQFMSVTMTKGSKTRQRVEAFLGRALIDGQDTGEEIGKALIGAKAIGMVGPNDKGKDAILGALQPYTAPAKAGKAAPASAAVVVLEDDLPAAQRTGGVAVVEVDEDPEGFAF